MMVERRRKTDWLAFIAFGLVVVMFVAGLKLNSDAREDADRKIAAAAVERVKQINESRRDVLIRACREQNHRHDKTIAVLDERIATIPPGARHQRAERSRDFTVALIESLAPKRHCIRRADRLIRPG